RSQPASRKARTGPFGARRNRGWWWIVTAAASGHTRSSADSACLVAGIVAASLAEAISGTLLALGRSDIMGDIHTTPDEFAWLAICYTAMKLIGFAAAPWLLTRVDARRALIAATAAMGLAAMLGSLAISFELLIALRLVQGLAGAVILVGGQTILFWRFAPERQPIVQAVFA